jgi:hypothetical protein
VFCSRTRVPRICRSVRCRSGNLSAVRRLHGSPCVAARCLTSVAVLVLAASACEGGGARQEGSEPTQEQIREGAQVLKGLCYRVAEDGTDQHLIARYVRRDSKSRLIYVPTERAVAATGVKQSQYTEYTEHEFVYDRRSGEAFDSDPDGTYALFYCER